MDVDGDGERITLPSPRLEAIDNAQMAPEECLGTSVYEPQSPMIPDTTYCQPYLKSAGEIFGHASTCFNILRHERGIEGLSAYHPFANATEWELAETLMTSGMSLGTIDKLLKLSIVSFLIASVSG